MTRTFYTADLHIGHEFVARTRGFKTARAHDRALAENWHREIGVRDTVWILGDVTLRGITEEIADYLDVLPGNKRLILGNHDVGHPMHRRWATNWRDYLSIFDTVTTEATVRIDGEAVRMSHFPTSGDHEDKHGNHQERYPDWRPRPNPGQWLLHGHVHGAWKTRERQINVGLDPWFMNPVPENTIIQLMRDY